jgi:hypothetical protein
MIGSWWLISQTNRAIVSGDDECALFLWLFVWVLGELVLHTQEKLGCKLESMQVR